MSQRKHYSHESMDEAVRLDVGVVALVLLVAQRSVR